MTLGVKPLITFWSYSLKREDKKHIIVGLISSFFVNKELHFNLLYQLKIICGLYKLTYTSKVYNLTGISTVITAAVACCCC